MEKYETENVELLKNYGLMHPDALSQGLFYDLRQMLEGACEYYFKQIDEIDLIDVIVRLTIGKHREWIHNRDIDIYTILPITFQVFSPIFYMWSRDNNLLCIIKNM